MPLKPFIVLTIALSVFICTRSERVAARDSGTPPLYKAGDIVRLRCDGGDELKRGSIYASPQAVWTVYDPSKPVPQPIRIVHWGTRLLVIATERHQTYTPISHTPSINLQILEVQPLGGAASWKGFVDTLSVDPDVGPRDPTNICT